MSESSSTEPKCIGTCHPMAHSYSCPLNAAHQKRLLKAKKIDAYYGQTRAAFFGKPVEKEYDMEVFPKNIKSEEGQTALWAMFAVLESNKASRHTTKAIALLADSEKRDVKDEKIYESELKSLVSLIEKTIVSSSDISFSIKENIREYVLSAEHQKYAHSVAHHFINSYSINASVKYRGDTCESPSCLLMTCNHAISIYFPQK